MTIIFDEFGDTDITKCDPINCKDKINCIRFLIKSNPYRQAFGNFEESKNHNGTCEYFIDKNKTY